MEAFLTRIDNICNKMVDAPGDALKKTQVVKGIDEPYYLFANAESLKESSWGEFF